jgi:4-amino-4-deoxy-L-arabinose transferase-like glycosyltransferase
MFKKNINFNLINILMVSVLLRLALPILALHFTETYQTFHAGDTPSFLQPATSLIQTGRFLDFDGTPNIFRTPGYPIFLIPGLILNQVEIITIVLQTILSTFTVYLVFQIGVICFNQKIAKLCALLYALEPLSILYTSLLLSETLFTALYTLFIYLLIKSIDNDYKLIKLLPIAGLCLSAAIYVRPIAYYLVILVPILLIFLQLKPTQIKKKVILVYIILFLIFSLTPVYLWQVRNKTQTGYSGISAVTEVNLYYWHAGAILTAKKQLSFNQVLEQLSHNLYNELTVEETKNKAKLYQYMREKGVKVIKDNPLMYLNLRLNGTVNLLVDLAPWPWLKLFKIKYDPSLFPMSITEFYQGGWLGLVNAYINKMPFSITLIWIILELIMIPYLVLALMGIFSNKLLNKIPIIIILSLGAYLIAITGGPEGVSSRYRHPIMPIICLFAGYGLNWVIKKFKVETL